MTQGNLLPDDQLAAKLQACPAPRVTKEQIESRIASRAFTKFNHTVTICQIELDNGYSVRGESACVNPENYDKEIGERVAYDNAFNKLWPLFGFVLAEDQHRAKTGANENPKSEGEQKALAPDQGSNQAA